MSQNTQIYYVDKSKNARATCKVCKTKIVAGELRLAKVVPSPYGENQQMKSWHHVDCMMNLLLKQRPTTKRIESIDDVGNWESLEKVDQEFILNKLNEMEKLYEQKYSGKYTARIIENKTNKQSKDSSVFSGDSSPAHTNFRTTTINNNFSEFTSLCQRIAGVDAYTEKSAIVNEFFVKGTNGQEFDGDLLLWCKLLLPQLSQRIYNLKKKQLVKLFSRIFKADQDGMLTHLEKGDVANTICTFFQQSKSLRPALKQTLTIHDVNDFLEDLSKLTKEDQQKFHIKKILPLCTADDLKMIIRLITGDLRINAGPKHILDGIHPDAYHVLQTSRNLDIVIDSVLKDDSVKHRHSIKNIVKGQVQIMTPVLPMLAEVCKSVEMAMKKCPNGMFAEIKYDGERVQIHKNKTVFKYFSRSLKPVMPHKIVHLKDFLPQAFPEGEDLILDAEILMVDMKTGKPLPFGTLGVHKQSEFKSAQVCLYVFDCLYYNGRVLMDLPIRKRREILHESMKEIKNRIMFSEQKLIKNPKHLASMIAEVFQQGLEGLVLKDLESAYEPGKRHWLKVKKDYLFGGAMADTADLVVLGSWFGTGKKGGMMSVFLMGCYDAPHDKWVTVTKVHTGHDDATLEKLQDELAPLMNKISGDYNKLPDWLNCNKSLVPDFVAKNPKKMPVWEITGTEFTKANIHTADGISVRFPRVTQIREDKDWKTATDLARLKSLFASSKEKTDVSLLKQLAGDSNTSKFEQPPSPSKPKKALKKINNYFSKFSKNSNDIPKSPESPEIKPEKLSPEKTNIESNTSNSPFRKRKESSIDLIKVEGSPSTTTNKYEAVDIKQEMDEEPSEKRKRKDRSPSKSEDSDSKLPIRLLPKSPLPNMFNDISIGFYPDFISFPENERRELERHWIAYGGIVKKSLKATDMDYLVHLEKTISLKSMLKLRTKLNPKVQHVSRKWLKKCIDRIELVDPTKHAVTVLL